MDCLYEFSIYTPLPFNLFGLCGYLGGSTPPQPTNGRPLSTTFNWLIVVDEQNEMVVLPRHLKNWGIGVVGMNKNISLPVRKIKGKTYIELPNGTLVPLENSGQTLPLQNFVPQEMIKRPTIDNGIKINDRWGIGAFLITQKTGRKSIRLVNFKKFAGKEGLKYYPLGNQITIYNREDARKLANALKSLSKQVEQLASQL